MVITPLVIGSRPVAVARPVPSQQDVDALVLQINGATGPELEALGRRIGGLSATPHADASQGARLAQLRLAMRIRRVEIAA